MYWSFLKTSETQDLQNSVEALLQLKLFLDDGYEYVNRDRNPDLAFHSILGCAVESLDPQVLLDPLEKQFNLPTAFI
jgi:hypothetical protein